MLQILLAKTTTTEENQDNYKPKNISKKVFWFNRICGGGRLWIIIVVIVWSAQTVLSGAIPTETGWWPTLNTSSNNHIAQELNQNNIPAMQLNNNDTTIPIINETKPKPPTTTTTDNNKLMMTTTKLAYSNNFENLDQTTTKTMAIVDDDDEEDNNNISASSNNESISTKLPEIMISNHACFTKSNVEQCHFTNQTTPYDCMWCDYWCVHKKAKIEGCHALSDQLEKVFSRPTITEIKPSFAFSDIPTMLSIYGSYLDVHSSSNIYNTVTSIVFNDKHICKIHSRNFSQIQCILEAINQTQTLLLKLSFARVVYDLNDTEEMDTKHCIDVHKNGDVIRSMEQYPQPNRLQIYQILIGLLIGMVMCSVAWISFIKRKYVDRATQIVRRRFVLQKMKQILIEKNLYKEYAKIELKNKLGEGNFGEVYAALITEYQNGVKQTTEMAIKKLKKGANLSKVRMFITEGIRMSMFQNDRILSPVAIFYENNQFPSIVLPIMKNGDLCRHLRQNKMFPIVQLLTFSVQVAEGMEYLSSIDFVHGDLAARNCLLDENMQIKIGDFGMSRHLYRTDYVTINYIDRPIRWMAPECLNGGSGGKNTKFTIKSDVWSYGVVLWEIFTIGSHPYEEFDNVDLCRHILTGYRLYRPTNCPQLIYQVMQQCWSVPSTERPTFNFIKQELSQILVSIAESEANSPSTISINRDHYNYTNLGDNFIEASSKRSSMWSSGTIDTIETIQTNDSLNSSYL